MKSTYFILCIALAFSAVNTHATSPAWLSALTIAMSVSFALLFLKSHQA